MRISDSIRVEPIFDYKHGRRFQILVVNKQTGENFTVHKDMLAREYIKLKLSEADIFQLIQELQKNLTNIQNDPKILEAKFMKNRFQVIKGDKKDE